MTNRHPHSFDWSEANIARLKGLWKGGMPSAEIGRQMGLSKNAVVGKAHRLDLTPRESPIIRQAGDVRRIVKAAKRAPRVTLAPLPQVEPTRVAVRVPAVAPVTVAAVAPRPYAGRVTECCWPIGEPGTRDFRMCDAPSVPRKPYCSEHADLAYVRVRQETPNRVGTSGEFSRVFGA